MLYGYGILNNHVPTLRAVMRGGGSSNPLNTSLYAVYKAESNANDSLLNYNGTPYGGLTYTTGKSGNAFQFNGTSSYIQIPYNIFSSTVEFSISFWVNFSSLTGNQFLFSNIKVSGGIYKGFGIVKNTANKINLQIYGASSTDIYSITTLNASTWYNIVITRNNLGSNIYINGALDNSDSSSVNPTYYTPQYSQIGAYDNTSSSLSYVTNGIIDELNIWGKQLTATEVTELYNAGVGKFYPY
ncbi:Concanavalin A-like lectin/glucanases superfamily [uncultured Caudovirales phage]|uniref:Concanavalin A-like lectin/glucanases superfamily n=1 Tax=uncultured Caudovirales phage TaxID=2100421 RepID=A0A6J5N267_9CAUD|nr:Concanavalin A-like lectin/glucanases superfamily [uncultured Caudovirales phage]